jgi:4-hydroxy-4-methyl-2-oxoglutarate aldolase
VRLLNTPENIVEMTRLYKGDRYDDGRPRVADGILDRMKLVTTEEAWRVCIQNGYNWQFEGNWHNLHPDHVLVGRAVTTMCVPLRPDFDALIEEAGQKEGFIGAGKQNSWVIDTLVDGDVLVVDLFGKVKWGTFVGDNLSTAIKAKGRRGLVVDGGIRDTQRIRDIPDFNVFCRGLDPTPRREITLTGINIPIRIGQATVLPGDVVLGTYTGVIFIPAHLAEAVVEDSERVRERDAWGQMRIRENVYTPGQIDGKWTPEIETDYESWSRENGRLAPKAAESAVASKLPTE